MTPERKTTIGNVLVEEFYWAGRFPCYVNHRLSADGYDDTVKKLMRGDTIAFAS